MTMDGARMAVLAIAVAIAGGCAGPAAAGETRSEGQAEAAPVRVDSAEAHRLVAEGATLLDVRTPAEYEARHIDGAVLVPVDEVASRLAEIPRDRPVVVYCASGRRSARAAGVLQAEGYEVRDLGGIDNW